jgi:hypothetical protein
VPDLATDLLERALQQDWAENRAAQRTQAATNQYGSQYRPTDVSAIISAKGNSPPRTAAGCSRASGNDRPRARLGGFVECQRQLKRWPFSIMQTPYRV